MRVEIARDRALRLGRDGDDHVRNHDLRKDHRGVVRGRGERAGGQSIGRACRHGSRLALRCLGRHHYGGRCRRRGGALRAECEGLIVCRLQVADGRSRRRGQRRGIISDRRGHILGESQGRHGRRYRQTKAEASETEYQSPGANNPHRNIPISATITIDATEKSFMAVSRGCDNPLEPGGRGLVQTAGAPCPNGHIP
ncbi:hypothetical protein CHELA1G11_10809 [Hyphomicrobiales bacterium]|nr:hypothetical protein CHELA1G11_10809 [Hyphomicrobiales bacterium]CAH1672117.1 hypothetical protein CHELA1G2_13500 [Hyphomicrobiales bacterium]